MARNGLHASSDWPDLTLNHGDTTMAISAKAVMDLRKKTGLGMMECKKALNETDGDEAAAIALLQETLGAKMDGRSDREAGEGAIAVATGAGEIAMILLKAETDFTAKNDAFVDAAQKVADEAVKCAAGEIAEVPAGAKESIDNLRITTKENISFGKGVKLTGEKVGSYVHSNRKIGVIVTGEGDLSDDLLKGICQHLVAADGQGQWPIPLGVDRDDLPADQVEAAKTAAVDEAKASGKPEEIATKIADGKMRKWFDDHTLMGQVYVREMDAKKPIRDYVPAGAKITGYKKFEL